MTPRWERSPDAPSLDGEPLHGRGAAPAPQPEPARRSSVMLIAVIVINAACGRGVRGAGRVSGGGISWPRRAGAVAGVSLELSRRARGGVRARRRPARCMSRAVEQNGAADALGAQSGVGARGARRARRADPRRGRGRCGWARSCRRRNAKALPQRSTWRCIARQARRLEPQHVAASSRGQAACPRPRARRRARRRRTRRGRALGARASRFRARRRRRTSCSPTMPPPRITAKPMPPVGRSPVMPSCGLRRSVLERLAASVRGGFAEQQRRAGGRVDLAAVMRLDDLDVPVGAELRCAACSHQRRQQVDAQAEIAGAHDGDALGAPRRSALPARP